jgi:hypothetical protein
MRLALHQPDQAGNVGTILRLAACLGVPVDVIEPCGFPWGDRALKRAGMDYAEIANVTRHAGWEAFEARRGEAAGGAVRGGGHFAVRVGERRGARGGACAGGYASADPAGGGDAVAEPGGGGGDRGGGGVEADGVVACTLTVR